MDDYFDRFFNSHETVSNYPPYNLVQVNNVESLLEIALAGFTKDEINVYTEYGKLFVEGQKETNQEAGSEYIHQGLAQRSFTRESGHFQKILKSERFNSKMDFLPLSWVR